MKLALLSNNENYELYEELKREFISESYYQHVEMILFDICQELQTDMSTIKDSDFHREATQTVILIINKVILDNVFKYITQSSISTFISLAERGMLGQDIFVNLFYARQISDILKKYFNVNEEELDSITSVLTDRLRYIINTMYCNNVSRYNEVIFRLLTNIHDIIRNIRFKYYKIELDQYYRPLIFYTEKDNNEAFCT